MENNTGTVILGRQANSWHGANRLAIQDNIGRTHAVLDSQSVPRRLYITVQVLFSRRTAAGAVAGVVIREYVAVES